MSVAAIESAPREGLPALLRALADRIERERDLPAEEGVFVVGGLTVDTNQRTCASEAAGSVAPPPRIFDTLAVLAESAGRLVSTETYYLKVYGGRQFFSRVHSANIDRARAFLREMGLALTIECRHGRGYLLVDPTTKGDDRARR